MDISPVNNSPVGQGSMNQPAQGNNYLQGNEMNGGDANGFASAGVGSSARTSFSPSAQTLADKFQSVKVLLDSHSSQQKLLGMKKVVAMMSKGKDVEELFPNVVKNVVCKTLEVKNW